MVMPLFDIHKNKSVNISENVLHTNKGTVFPTKDETSETLVRNYVLPVFLYF